MSRVLDVNELLDLAADAKLPNLSAHVTAMEAATTLLTAAIAEHLGIAHTGANWEPGFGGLCGVFQPKEEGQPLPAVMEEYDTGGDWEL